MDDIEELHRTACREGRAHYRDPETGYLVFTEHGHRTRGYCCGNGCRHCPFGHHHAREVRNAITAPVLIPAGKRRPAGPTRVLFWSGGKDSFQALRRIQGDERAAGRAVTLLTSFDKATGTVAFQNTTIQDVMEQARALGLDLLAVPLQGGGEPTARGNYEDTVREALGLLEGRVEALVFGDLHLADIRGWREEAFGGTWRCEFPLFGVPYNELFPRLWAEEGVSIAVTAVEEGVAERHGGVVRVGHAFNRDLVEKLAGAGLDPMGENGEFHTHVTFCRGGG